TLHSLPLAAPTLIFLELQVLEHNSFVLFLCVVDDLLHQASNIIISLIRAAVENSCIDEGFGFNQVPISTHIVDCNAVRVRVNTNHTIFKSDTCSSFWFIYLIVNNDLEVLVVFAFQSDIIGTTAHQHLLQFFLELF